MINPVPKPFSFSRKKILLNIVQSEDHTSASFGPLKKLHPVGCTKLNFA